MEGGRRGVVRDRTNEVVVVQEGKKRKKFLAE